MTNKTQIYNQKRKIILNRQNNKCQICGKESNHIHHKNKNHDDNRLSNLMVVCPKCHKSFHPTKRYVDKFTKSIFLEMSDIFYKNIKAAAKRKEMSISQFIRTSVITKIESED